MDTKKGLCRAMAGTSLDRRDEPGLLAGRWRSMAGGPATHRAVTWRVAGAGCRSACRGSAGGGRGTGWVGAAASSSGTGASTLARSTAATVGVGVRGLVLVLRVWRGVTGDAIADGGVGNGPRPMPAVDDVPAVRVGADAVWLAAQQAFVND